MLEVLLAVIVIAIASFGVYELYKSGSNQNTDTATANQLMQISSTYSNLISSSLTNNTTSSSALISLLQNSNQLSSNYFNTSSGSTVMQSPYGALSFSNVTPISYDVEVPYSNKTLQQAEALFNQISSSYSCISNCSSDDSSSSSDGGSSGNIIDSFTVEFNASGTQASSS